MSANRRQFLRGLLGGTAVTVALPLLDAGLNSSGTALADGTPMPKRFGVFFWGNGVRLDKWNPSSTGSGDAWSLSEELAPLASVKDYVSVVSGMSVMTGNERGHHAGCVGILSGAPMISQDPKGASYASTFSGKSIDQIVAAEIGKTSRFKSLEMAVSRSIVGSEGTTLRYMSHNGPDDANPPELDPKKLFERVFGVGFEDPELKKRAEIKVGLRRSVLDAITKEANALSGRVGAADRIRLQAHLDGIRALEKRLATLPPTVGACAKPTAPGGFSEPDGKEALEERMHAFSDLLALVFACDISRVFTIQFTGSVNYTVFWEVGASQGHHELSHDEAGDQPTIHAATVFSMKQLGYLLQKLKDTPEGTGNLLDSTAILASSDTSHGREHSIDDYPIVIAGKAGGALKGNVHYRSKGENTSKALFSLTKAMGVPGTEFGKAGGRVTSSCTAIES
ncbi:MAG: DUF1552 domain-containing protein [Polyangiales bacterium]